MRGKQRTIHKKEHTLRCPACLKSIDNTPSCRAFAPETEALLPKPGDLIQCDNCDLILEYLEGSIVRRASQKRVDQLREFLTHTPYRQTPVRPPIRKK